MSSSSKVRSWWFEHEIPKAIGPVVGPIAEGEENVAPAVAIGPSVLGPLVETIGVIGDEPDPSRHVWFICAQLDADDATEELLNFLADPSFRTRARRSFEAGGFNADATSDLAVRRATHCALEVLEDLIGACSHPEKWASALLDQAEAWRLEQGGSDLLAEGVIRSTQIAVAARHFPMPRPTTKAVERWHARQAEKVAAAEAQQRDAARRSELDELAGAFYAGKYWQKQGGAGCGVLLVVVLAAAILVRIAADDPAASGYSFPPSRWRN